MTPREQLEAEAVELERLAAEKRAQAAAMEPEINWPLILRQMAYAWSSVANGDDQSRIAPKFKMMCHDLADQLSAHAPLAPAMTDAQVEELARDCVKQCTTYPRPGWSSHRPQEIAEAAIRATLAHLRAAIAQQEPPRGHDKE